MRATRHFRSARTFTTMAPDAPAPAADLAMDEILDGLAEGFFALDSCWRFVAFNRAAEEIFALRREDVVSRTIWEVSPTAVGTEFERRYRLVMTTREKQVFKSYSTRRPDRYHEIRAFPLGDGIGVAFRDVTDRQAMLETLRRRELERKLAEKEAMESAERLRAIADALPVLISYVDSNQVYRFVNKTYETWFDRPRSEIVGRRVDDVMSPEMYHARQSNLERALAGEEVSYEVEFPRSNGMTFTEVTHVPHRDASGRVLGAYVVVTDVTQRKLSERAIAESEARFRAIANSAPVPMWVTGSDGRREFVNQAYIDFFGGSYEEALALDWRKALHPDDLPRILREEPAIQPSVKSVAVEARFRRADGQWRWLQAESQPRWSHTGEHVGFIGVAHDVMVAKRAQEELTRINETLERRVEERTAELAASEALVRTFFQHSPECHFVLVEDGGSFRFQEINPATLRLYGKTRAEVVGRETEEVLGPEKGAELNRHLEACLRDGGPYRYEKTHEGKSVEVVATAVPSGNGEARRVVVSARDVSERRRLEEQLRQAQKMEALGQLTGGVAHDFNNMLTLMLGGLDTIDRQLVHLPAAPAKARIERAKDMALQGVQRARALTGRLLAFSRRQALAPQAVDVNALVGGIGDLLQRTLGQPISLKTILPNPIWNAYVDPNQLESALVNLALNARDAMPRGGRLIIETADRRLDANEAASFAERVEPGEYVTITVMDTGVGMDAETLARAFDPFFTTKEVGKGTGLGLSQVYGFCHQSGGHVQIESEPGRGTTVRMFLPRQAAPSSGLAERNRAELDRPGGRESILLVEDDDSVRAYAMEALRELGYRVAEASSGKAALTVLDGAPKLDLLLTDVVMPGDYNGRELAEEALKRRPGLRVLYMTGYSRDAIMQDGRLDPGAHLLGKPFSMEELAAKVRSGLDAAK